MGFGDILKGIGGIASLFPGVGTAIGMGTNALGGLFDSGGDSSSGGSSLLETAMPGLVQGGFGLLGSILSGAGKKQDLKNEMKAYQKKADIDYSQYMKKGQEQERRMNQNLKPTLERYSMEKDMPSIDPAFKKIILGSLGDTLGSSRLGKYGVDLKSLLSGIGGGSSPTAGIPEGTFGAAKIPGNLAENIQKKYNMHGKRQLD